MPNLIVFEFGGKKVRTAGTPDLPLFCAADVCLVLGIANASDACSRLDQDEQELVSVKTGSGAKHAIYVTESGLFALVLTSRKPEAKPFRKWVTSEVLPEIRRTGLYSMVAAAERKKLIDECFRALPAKQATLFNPLIEELRKFARVSDGGSGGTPPWARMIACWIYEWTWRENKGELRKRNAKQADGTLIWRDYEALTEEGRRKVTITISMAVFAARESFSWSDWRSRMEAYFCGQKLLPMSEPERVSKSKRLH
jgi:prophage antirepressor-like protein